jgi:Helix-turn-helix of DDE superfamily endonuclease/DDE superfamily endonuclease
MLEYTEIRKHKRRFLALTGLTDKEFKALLPHFRSVAEGLVKPTKTKAGKKRKRNQGGGRKSKLALVEDQLLFILVYQKSYPLQELLAQTYGVSQTSVNTWIHHYLPILKQALDDMGVMPERHGKNLAKRQAAKGKTTKVLAIDGTERRIQRPGDNVEQQEQYSGKKHGHMDKNVIVAEVASKEVVYLSPTYVGRTHDKAIADEEKIVYPQETSLHQDAGFQGYAPKVKEVLQPKKSRVKAS